MQFSITNKTRQKILKLPFEKAAKSVLGKEFELSLVFIGDKGSLALNRRYGNKNYSSNVLAFPISKNSGEIFLALRQAQDQAERFGMKLEKFVFYLFIHGLLHLKGFGHGSTMEREEEKILRKFKFNVETNRHRGRYRHISS